MRKQPSVDNGKPGAETMSSYHLSLLTYASVHTDSSQLSEVDAEAKEMEDVSSVEEETLPLSHSDRPMLEA